MSMADIATKSSSEWMGTSGQFDASGRNESGVSWAAVIAGGFVTAALSLVLLSLGAGLGLSSISPWENAGVTASKVGTATIVWLIFNELVASAMGGYLAGRLRTKWVSIHTDEVYFRNTAHGFLVWAVAVVMTVAFLASGAVSMAGGENSRTFSAIQGRGAAPASSLDSDSSSYFVDMLFRSERIQTGADNAGLRAEASRVMAHGLSQNAFGTPDETYLAQLVAAQTGLTQPEAQQRVSAVVSQAEQNLDDSRKAAAHLLLWIFLALLIGAFSASLAATIGGRQRDHVKAI